MGKCWRRTIVTRGKREIVAISASVNSPRSLVTCSLEWKETGSVLQE